MSRDRTSPTTPAETPSLQVSRRGFIASVGTGALTAAAVSQAAAAPARPPIRRAADLAKVTLTVNGHRHEVLAEPRWSLSYVLREHLGLTGTKEGCERGECGACTVLIEGVPRYACMTLAAEAEGAKIVTVEGLMRGEALGPTQQAFVEKDGYQCGFCTSGQIMAAEGLLKHDHSPSRDAIRRGMSGNLCRCGAYPHIVEAVERAAELRRGGAS